MKLASDGEDVIEIFKKNIKSDELPFDVIILDINMPVLDGAETAKQIREIERKYGIKRTPLIALTADRYEKGYRRLINMDEYLSIPIDLKQLLSILIKYTSNQDVKIENKKGNKLRCLKEIKDSMINKPIKNGIRIKDFKQYFNVKEYKLLKKMVKDAKNKKKLRETYNKLMKLIRKSTY